MQALILKDTKLNFGSNLTEINHKKKPKENSLGLCFSLQ